MAFKRYMVPGNFPALESGGLGGCCGGEECEKEEWQESFHAVN